MRPRRLIILTLALTVGGAALIALAPRLYPAVMQRLRGRATIEDRIAQHGEGARSRLRPYFERAGVAYPPRRVALLGLKQERVLHVYAGASEGDLRHIASYPVLAASGTHGPKLRRGDRQVPEGIYRVESLNPNSLYHLSLRLNYPNEFDAAMAARDGRRDLGGDIMIHGRNASVGCLAMGDPAAEELFTLAHDAGVSAITVVIAPADPRTDGPLPGPESPPAWLAELHEAIRAAAAALPPAP